MLEELWRDRCAAMGMHVYHPRPRRGKAKVYAVRKGKKCGIFYSFVEAEEHTMGVSCAEWKGFKSMARAQEYLAKGIREGLRTGEEKTMEIYTDGSFFKSPDRAGWGLLVLHPGDSSAEYRTRTVHYQAQGAVCTNKLNQAEYLGAMLHTNNTGELSSVGSAEP